MQQRKQAQRSLSGFWREPADDRILEMVSVLRGASNLIGLMGSDLRVTWSGQDGLSYTDLTGRRVALDYGPLVECRAPFPGGNVDEVIGYAAHEGGHCLWSDPQKVFNLAREIMRVLHTLPNSLQRAWANGNRPSNLMPDGNGGMVNPVVVELSRVQNILEDAYIDNEVARRWPVLGEHIRISRQKLLERRPIDLQEIARLARPDRNAVMNLWLSVALYDCDLPVRMSVRVRRAMAELLDLTNRATQTGHPGGRHEQAVQALGVLYREFPVAEAPLPTRPKPEPPEPKPERAQDQTRDQEPDEPEDEDTDPEADQDQEETGDGEGDPCEPGSDLDLEADGEGDGEDEGESDPDQDQEGSGSGEGDDWDDDDPDADGEGDEEGDQEALGGEPVEGEDDDGEDEGDGEAGDQAGQRAGSGASAGPEGPEQEGDPAPGQDPRAELIRRLTRALRDASDQSDRPEPQDRPEADPTGAGDEPGTVGNLDDYDNREVTEVPEEILEQIAEAIIRELEDLTAEVAEILAESPENVLATARKASEDAQRAREVTQRVMPQVQEIRRVFDRQQDVQSRYLKGLDRGRLHSRSLAKVGAGDLNVFQRRQVIERPDLAVGLLLDVSGSMIPHYQVVEEAAAIFAEGLMRKPGVNFACWSYTGGHGDVELTRLCDRHMGRLCLADVSKAGGTPSGAAIAGVKLLMDRMPERRKLLIHFTDGEPDVPYHVVRSVRACQEARLRVYALGMARHARSLDAQYGAGNYATLQTVADLPRAVARLVENLDKLQK